MVYKLPLLEFMVITQLTFTSSKSAIETLEKKSKIFKYVFTINFEYISHIFYCF